MLHACLTGEDWRERGTKRCMKRGMKVGKTKLCMVWVQVGAVQGCRQPQAVLCDEQEVINEMSSGRGMARSCLPVAMFSYSSNNSHLLLQCL